MGSGYVPQSQELGVRYLSRSVDAKNIFDMKKYSESIEVRGENIKALFDCPIVTDIKKATDAVNDGLDVDDMLVHVVILSMQGTHVQVKRGNVLVRDICGHWEVMTSDDWEMHKEDAIDVPSEGGDTDTPSAGTDKSDKVDGGDSSSSMEGGLLD